MTVGERIQALRKNLGLSQDELGQRLLVSRQTISLWENDQTVPTIDNLKRLKEIFGVSVDEILGNDEPSKQPVPEDKDTEAPVRKKRSTPFWVLLGYSAFATVACVVLAVLLGIYGRFAPDSAASSTVPSVTTAPPEHVHAFDSDCDTVCDDCDMTRSVTHTHNGEWVITPTVHYHICTVCGAHVNEDAHVYCKAVVSDEYLRQPATETTPAFYWLSCACGKASNLKDFAVSSN